MLPCRNTYPGEAGWVGIHAHCKSSDFTAWISPKESYGRNGRYARVGKGGWLRLPAHLSPYLLLLFVISALRLDSSNNLVDLGKQLFTVAL